MQLNSLMASGLNNKIVKVPCISQLIQKSDGFKKKELATYKIDLQLLCGFGIGTAVQMQVLISNLRKRL